MLVLSRKSNESIRIGDEITIKVISVRGGRVRIGIDAPEDVIIRRSELSGSLRVPAVAALSSVSSTSNESWETDGGRGVLSG